ncbi:MAG TPA: carotenoid oxygenase family protein [Pseudonocardiaceae bacterium]|jgi:carotenoid cleavage dioxygenase|nr:carotenoid oxygenase family protein [Pseudonocardiaceae bacterium]
MSTTMQPPAYLTGNYAPVTEELSVYDLPVTGAVPPELSGWYLRNGPNPHEADTGHWFLGDGMVHGVRLESGRAKAYRNRWVRTKEGPHRDEHGVPDLEIGQANTHVVRHAGRTFALVESSFPYELDCRPGHELETVGPYDFDGKLATAMTAHPKTCPTTGELHFFGYATEAPYLTYHRADRDGELVVSRPIDVPGSTMMHDFQLTAEHVIFMDLPVVFDLELAKAEVQTMPYTWQPEYGARLGVLRRDDPYGQIRWLSIDPCYVFHTLNAYDEGDGDHARIVMYVSRYPHLSAPELGDAAATLWRWTIDLRTGKVDEEQIDDRVSEFPRVDDRLAGRRTRHGHLITAGGLGSDHPSALLRYDLDTGAVVRHDFGPGRQGAEASFAPADDQPGGPGWLMSYVYDAATNTSDLVIVDADALESRPVATIHLPTRVPFGFHGNWLPSEPLID